MSDYLPINALSDIIIVSGQIRSNEPWTGPTIPVALHRQSTDALDVLDDEYTKNSKLNFSDFCEPYPDPPFELPPPANLVLHLRLGQLLSEGRTGMIFDCECSIPYGNEVLGYRTPPMVVKLARQSRSSDLMKEAIMYENLRCLQGSAIPRCYGFFQVRLIDYFDFGPMSVLLLEKLGSPLKLGEPLPDGAEADIKTACSDLAHCRVFHKDLRWENILSVLRPEEGSLPSLPSPFSGKTYSWRLVDFDQAKRTAREYGRVQSCYYGYLNRVLEGITLGQPVEPWE